MNKTNNMTQQTIKLEDFYPTEESLISDPQFKESIQAKLDELTHNRRQRPEPPVGQRYKRDWYDRMNSEGTLHSQFFLENVISVWSQTSNLSSNVRAVVEYVCNNALNHLLSEKVKARAESTPKQAENQENKQI